MHSHAYPKPSGLVRGKSQMSRDFTRRSLICRILSDRRWARSRAGGRRRTERSCGKLKRLGVADGDAENAAIGGLEDHGDAVAVPADRRLNLASVAGKLRDFADSAHDIDMRQGPPAIFTALHRADMPAVEADQQDRGGYPAPPGPTLACAWR